MTPEERKLKSKEYYKAYYQANKARKQAYYKEYYLTNIEELKEKNGSYRQANKDRTEEYFKEYYQANKDRIIDRTKKYYKVNKDKIEEYRKEYRHLNRAKFLERNTIRRCQETSLTHPDRNQKIIKVLYEMSSRLTVCTGIEHHVDHIIPISKGGWHHELNLQVITATLNLQKKDRMNFCHDGLKGPDDVPDFLK